MNPAGPPVQPGSGTMPRASLGPRAPQRVDLRRALGARGGQIRIPVPVRGAAVGARRGLLRRARVLATGVYAASQGWTLVVPVLASAGAWGRGVDRRWRRAAAGAPGRAALADRGASGRVTFARLRARDLLDQRSDLTSKPVRPTFRSTATGTSWTQTTSSRGGRRRRKTSRVRTAFGSRRSAAIPRCASRSRVA
jgi:hypothetical protein